MFGSDVDKPVNVVELGSRSDPRVQAQDVAIEINDVTLQYPLKSTGRGSLKSALFSLFGHREAKVERTYVDALKSVSLSISRGERLAIIGHNGSGKSTILRAMAGIYPLKSGSIRAYGQIGSVLDIGLGFEAESSGRENIYYRGMTMGYSRKQIAEMEEEIVEFADLGEFIDLPMRTYSSGMYVRLGFAVSTQFTPEILLVDEVFGAGDASFAKRALQRMYRIVEQAGIVVLATHDMGLVQELATRVIWMEGGRIRMEGGAVSVTQAYLAHMNGEDEPEVDASEASNKGAGL